MKHIRSIHINKNRNEELLPDFSSDFPYIASCAELDSYLGSAVPWHWHHSVELFYIESGILEYTTPSGTWTFPAGSGGFINSNILHRSKTVSSEQETIQLLHLFEPKLLSGGESERIYAKYIRPLTMSSHIEVIPLSPQIPQQAEILKKIRNAFELNESSWGYEFTLRQYLTEIWLALLELVYSEINTAPPNKDAADKMKVMMQYIHTHYAKSLSVEVLAKEAHISKRVCFRLFQENLHTSPLEYITNYRLQQAYQQLLLSNDSITQIAYNCGFGSSSYFGKIFRKHFNCTPIQLRKSWHECNKSKHK